MKKNQKRPTKQKKSRKGKKYVKKDISTLSGQEFTRGQVNSVVFNNSKMNKRDGKALTDNETIIRTIQGKSNGD